MKNTVRQLLTDDKRKSIAEKLLDGSINEVIVIYSDNDALSWESTMKISQVIGALEMVLRIQFCNIDEDENNQLEA